MQLDGRVLRVSRFMNAYGLAVIGLTQIILATEIYYVGIWVVRVRIVLGVPIFVILDLDLEVVYVGGMVLAAAMQHKIPHVTGMTIVPVANRPQSVFR